MADTNTTQTSDDDAPKKKFDSPWDEELPPEEPKKAKVVGSLDAKPSDLSTPGGDKKPVPFNIPTDVSDEKVGKKIPAQAVITNDPTPVKPKPSSFPPIQNIPKPSAAPVPKQPANILSAVPVSQTQPPKINSIPNKTVSQPPKPIVKSAQEQPVVIQIPKPVSQPVPEVIPTPTPISKPIIQPETAKISPKPIQIEKPVSKPIEPKPVKLEGGVNELIQPKAVPITTSPITENKTIPNLSQSSKPAPVTAIPKLKPEVKQTSPVPVTVPKPVPEAKPTPKPVISVPIYPAPVANLKNESGTLADIKPAEKRIGEVEKEEPPPILPNISKPVDLSDEDELKPPSYITNRAKPAEKIEKKKDTPPEIRKPVLNNEPPFYKRVKFLVPAIAIFLFVLGVYLTEAGLIGIGFEKVYGLTGIEALWGGLPRNPEKALGISAQAMQKQLNFKIKGSISMTVNKTIKSPVTSPLVSVINLPYAFRDTNVIAGASAVITQYDYYGDSTSSSTTPDSASVGSSTDTTTNATTGTDSTTSTTTPSTDTTTPALGDQNSSTSYTPEESTIKQVDADIVGQSSDQAISSDLIIKKLVGSSSSVSLVGTKSQLFVKSSPDIQFATNAEQNKWLEFNISKIQNENPFKDFTTIKLDQGFSIIGRRSGNEKVGSVRCFKYTIDNLEIGDSLGFLGIPKDSVQKINGNIWIGAADHYLHKIDLKIIPSISSSISQMSVTLEMYDYGIDNSIQIPALADKIVANISADANASATTTTPTTTTPSVASAVTLEERDQTRKQDLQNIKAALEKYKSANGKFPVANSLIHLDSKDNVVQKALVAEYITIIPTDPKASDGWFYGYESNGSKFTLSARLENSADKQVTKVGDIYLHWVYNN